MTETQVVEYSVTNNELAELAAKYKEVPDAGTKEGYLAIKECLSEIRPLRTAVEKRRKELKADALSWGRKVDSEAKRIREALQAIEVPFINAKAEEESRVEKATEALREAEEARILAIQGRVSDIHKQTEGLLNATSEEIKARISAVLDIPMESFEEFTTPADFAKKSVLESLKEALDAKVIFEAQQVEQAKVAKEQAEKQAELERKELDQFVAMEAKQKEFEASEAALKAQQDKLERDRKAEEALKEAERVRVQQVADAAKVALAKKEEDAREEKRQEMLRPDKEILKDWILKLRFIDAPDGLKDPLMVEFAQQTMEIFNRFSLDRVELLEQI